MPSYDIRSIPLTELPEGEARRALAAELTARRAYIYKTIPNPNRPTRSIIWLDSGPYAEQHLAFCRMARLQPEQRLFVDEWLALYTACQNAEQNGGTAA